jgi:pyruvate dehydrogenase E1 component alpha subunit
MHLVDPSKGMLGSAPIVAGTIALALGAALASSIRDDGRITISFFGDGATGEGVLYEAMNFASLRKLPIIFACENNYYATHMPIRDCRVFPDIYKIAEPFGIRSDTIDGNDVMTVYEEGKRAAGLCRRGHGPVFLELRTYRFRGHVGPDDNIQGSHTDIRPKEEMESWLDRDPLILFERKLLEEERFTKKDLEVLQREVTDEIDAAFEFAKKSAAPSREEVYKHVFQ